MRYYLGLDGGGTKTVACILDENRAELGRGFGGPCNIATGTPESQLKSVRLAASEALAVAGLSADTKFEVVCAGVAGYSAKRCQADFQNLLSESVPSARHRLEPDFVIAYWGATEGEPGIIVSAGTGAVVYGRNAEGESCRIDGRGFLLGDRGSGFEIGKFAIQSTLAVLANCHEPGPFHASILVAIGAEDIDDLIEWVYRDFQPARIASLAPVVGRLACEGDDHARRLIQGAGQDLGTSFQRTRRKLNMPDCTPVYALGSLWNLGDPLIQGFHRGFDQLPPPDPIEILAPKHDAAYGAALLAIQQPPQDLERAAR